MKINETVLNTIKDYTIRSMTKDGIAYESGGILGRENGVVDHVMIDKGLNSGHSCIYIPDTTFINSCIHKWGDEGIEFCGIYHIHNHDVSSLSVRDREYIETIMRAMPKHISRLYFPIYCIPSCCMVCYKAVINGKTVSVKKEVLDIMKPINETI